MNGVLKSLITKLNELNDKLEISISKYPYYEFKIGRETCVLYKKLWLYGFVYNLITLLIIMIVGYCGWFDSQNDFIVIPSIIVPIDILFGAILGLETKSNHLRYRAKDPKNEGHLKYELSDYKTP